MACDVWGHAMITKAEEFHFAIVVVFRRELVHGWVSDDYELAGIYEYFGYGRWEEDVLILTARDVMNLRIQADAESFDHEEGLIRLCLDLERFQKAHGLDLLHLIELG